MKSKLKRVSVAKVVLISILTISTLLIPQQTLADGQRRIDDIGLAILKGLEGYDGTQASFSEHFFQASLPMAYLWLTP